MNPLKNQNYRIFSIEKLDRGIYSTFFDFRDYTPDTIRQFSVKYKGDKNSSRIAVLKGINNKKIKDVWGFSDGDQNYVRWGNEFFSIHKEGDIFSIYNYPPDFESKIAMSQVLGGLFFSSMYMAGVKKIKYNIDLSISRFYPQGNSQELMIESRIIILSSQYNDVDKEIELFINDKRCGILNSGTYSVLRFDSNVKDVDICLSLNGENICINSQPVLFNTYLYLAKIKGDKIIIKNPPSNIRNELISDIEEGKYKRIEK
jgi:hypothetical protein